MSERMTREEAHTVAVASAPNDPVQQQITEDALMEASHGVVTVREIPGGDPPWQAYRYSKPVSFAGAFIYGGETREEAVQAAARIASKWDWPTDFSEAPMKSEMAALDDDVLRSLAIGGDAEERVAAKGLLEARLANRVAVKRRSVE